MDVCCWGGGSELKTGLITHSQTNYKNDNNRVMMGQNGNCDLLYNFRLGKLDLNYWDWDLQSLKQ